MNLFGKDPRPAFNEERMTQLVNIYLPEVLKWLNSNDEESTREELTELFTNNSTDDGYELAKILEDDYYYDSDSELVSILDNVEYDKSNILNKALKEWVITDNILPTQEIGTVVKFKLRGKKTTGTIVDIYRATAYYIVEVNSAKFCIPYEEIHEL